MKMTPHFNTANEGWPPGKNNATLEETIIVPAFPSIGGGGGF